MNSWRMIGLSVGFGLVLVMGVLFGVSGTATAVAVEYTNFVYLPVIIKPVLPPPVLTNPSFEDSNWETVDYGNQIPPGWEVTWLNNGDLLYDGSETVTGICECVHKWDWQLPPDQKPGGPDALILDGVLVYKVFSNQKFGAQMSQTITNAQPGSQWQLIVPMRVHLHGDTDPYGAQARVMVNGQGDWVNGFEMGDEQWYTHTVSFTVPTNGEIEVIIQMQNKWRINKDFFIDDVRLEHIP